MRNLLIRSLKAIRCESFHLPPSFFHPRNVSFDTLKEAAR